LSHDEATGEPPASATGPAPSGGVGDGWDHRVRSVGGVRLHCVESGSGPLVVLLHGFPEFWYSWRHQIPALARAGFHVVAPDLRGYNDSDRPADVSSYRVSSLVEDIAGLIEDAGAGRAYLVGHDWGGVIAWRVAALRPGLVRRIAILNAPHPAAYREELRRNPGQWLRSSYILLFQLPWLPERLLGTANLALLERAWRRQPVHPGAFSAQDIAAYKQALGRPGGLRGPLHYYRAALRHPQDLSASPQSIDVPSLLIWGERDPYLSPSLPERATRWVSDLRIERIPDASHWVQNDVPDRVNRLLIDFFGGQDEALKVNPGDR
jgi:pimeloyl-ACP methyl ester carboxylesterase